MIVKYKTLPACWSAGKWLVTEAAALLVTGLSRAVLVTADSRVRYRPPRLPNQTAAVRHQQTGITQPGHQITGDSTSPYHNNKNKWKQFRFFQLKIRKKFSYFLLVNQIYLMHVELHKSSDLSAVIWIVSIDIVPQAYLCLYSV